MAKIILSGSGEPENPATGKYAWWIDSSDGKMKYKDSTGSITEVTTGADGVDGADGDSMFETTDNVITQVVATDVFKPSLIQISTDSTDTTGWGADELGRLRTLVDSDASGVVNKLQMWSMGNNGTTSGYAWRTVFTGNQDTGTPTE